MPNGSIEAVYLNDRVKLDALTSTSVIRLRQVNEQPANNATDPLAQEVANRHLAREPIALVPSDGSHSHNHTPNYTPSRWATVRGTHYKKACRTKTLTSSYKSSTNDLQQIPAGHSSLSTPRMLLKEPNEAYSERLSNSGYDQNCSDSPMALNEGRRLCEVTSNYPSDDLEVNAALSEILNVSAGRRTTTVSKANLHVADFKIPRLEDRDSRVLGYVNDMEFDVFDGLPEDYCTDNLDDEAVDESAH